MYFNKTHVQIDTVSTLSKYVQLIKIKGIINLIKNLGNGK